MSTLYPEKRREDATHRYEICSEDSYRPYINNISKANIYKPGILELSQCWNGLLLVDTSATARSRPTH